MKALLAREWTTRVGRVEGVAPDWIDLRVSTLVTPGLFR